MSQPLIVVQRSRQLEPYSRAGLLTSFTDYVSGDYARTASRSRIINLCRKYSYLSEGYYCSLLAEARGEQVIPTLQTLAELGNRSVYRLQVDALDQGLFRDLEVANGRENIQWLSFFGHADDPHLSRLARLLFETFPCPILEVSMRRRKGWQITRLRPLSPDRLDPDQQSRFAIALEEFSRKVWRKPTRKRQSRFDLAILCDPGEAMPPSDTRALKRFIRAGRQLGVDCDLITRRDYLKLPEYDGLFIRATTGINHYTYRFARKAENEGLVSLDDSASILRCTNKIYLADLFRKYKVPSPRTVVLHRDCPEQLRELESTLGFPVVVKIPDGAFSRGVEKAVDREGLKSICKRLFKQSTLLLAQEFIYTDFDWRIGVLDGQPLYACRYYMVKRHWQIYRHGKRTASGGFDTVPLSEIPEPVLQAALNATRPIGNSIYGVDLKEKDGRGFVIEVNDNPSIDCGIEDRHLGMELYIKIMASLLRRMEARRLVDPR